ncbi:MAG: hypothetical protein DMG04_29125 [Acidobacteria bacterium]|nr:MAG: hypothetical protein DMG04_29125 [Acidobacteriota bacterium]
MLIGTRVPSARTSVWNRMPRRARSLNLPPRSTSVTAPIARAPDGIATRSPTLTSRVTRASTRSSTRAVSLEIRFSVCRPITESRETTSSSNCFCGGSGAGGGVCAACSSGLGAAGGSTGVVGAGAVAGDGCDPAALDGHVLASGGGCCRVAAARAGAFSARFAAAIFGASLFTGVFGSATTASVSWTGRSATAAGAAGAGVVAATGCVCAAAGAGTAFCREARYPPPAAAATQATANAANASRFESMTETPRVPLRQAAYPAGRDANQRKSA